MVGTLPVRAGADVMLVTDAGRLIRIGADSVRITGRQATGVTLFRVSDGEAVTAVFPVVEAVAGLEDADPDVTRTTQCCPIRVTPMERAMPTPTTTPLPARPLDRHTGIYPGTFDPVTNGHMDIIHRAARILDRLVVGVAANDGKGPIFPIEERMELVRAETDAIAARTGCSIEVTSFRGLLVEFARVEWRNRDHPRPARRQRFRLRVPDGRHELPAGPGDRDGVPDRQRARTSSSRPAS